MKNFNNRRRIRNRKMKRHEKNLKRKRKELEKQNKYQHRIIYRIDQLPKEIQRKICILTWRKYWRNFIPITAKIPSWTYHANHVQKQLWGARQKNIHFMHLSFNTLPKNKQWIMGCQCDFCLNDTKITQMKKHCHYLCQYRHSAYFSDKFMPNETVGIWNEKLSYPHNNITGFNSGNTLVKVFDPLCGSYKENKTNKRLREGIPIQFNIDNPL